VKQFFLFLSLILIQNLFAQTVYYVKTDGNNVNDGKSWGAAKATIQAAHDASAAGDVILVKYGTYTLSTVITISKNIKITSDDGDGTGWSNAGYDSKRCILNGSSSNANTMIMMTSASITNNCIIRGLQLTGATGTNNAAIYIQYGYPIIEFCKFYNNSSRGIRCDNSSMIARNNIFENNNECGMYTYQGSGTVKFYNNLIVNSHDGFASDASTVKLYNNTIAHCSEALKIGDASIVNIYNSILVNNEYAIYNYASENNTVSFTNCRVWSNTTGIGGNGVSTQTNTTTTDPSFVGTGDNPYSLQNTSDCVNSGSGLTTTEIGTSDIIGANRFYNNIEDLGAYELQANGILVITDKSPRDGNKIPNMNFTDLTFSFNRDVTPHGGDITLFAQGGSVIKQLSSTNSDVVVNGRNITVHMNVTLVSGTRYYINISPTAFDDGLGFYYSGISNDIDWDWTTSIPDNFPGGALEFDGTNDYVNITDYSAMDLTDNYTLEVWINPKSFASMSGIYSKFSGGNSGGIRLCLTSEAPYQGIYFDGKRTAPNILTANTWYHITVVRNSSDKKIYINGVEPALSGAFVANVENSDPVTFGSDQRGNYFNGLLDEVRLWRTARSTEQIREDMYLTSSETASYLVGYWQFNESSGTSLLDRKAGMDGTLTNMSNSNWVTSTIPKGGGHSNTQSISSSGNVTFTATDFSMYVNSKTGTDSYTATKIEYAPNASPSGVTRTYNNQYWVVHKYGSGSCDANLSFIISESVTQDEKNNLGSITLFKREYNSTGNWEVVTSAASYNISDNSFTFNNVSSDGQFIIARRAGMSLAIVNTNSVTNDGPTSVTSGGNVTSEEGVEVTARGVCWSTSSNPTTANLHTTDGTGTGSFTSSITGLTVNTKYYVRAYAINTIGTSYGDELNFITYSGSGSGTVSDPFLIESLEQLNSISSNTGFWDRNFKQINNINASATSTLNSDGGSGYYGFSPIGNSSTKFTGTYNGHGYSISNIYINRGTTDYIGFFGYTLGGSISNLNLSSINIHGQYFVGGLVGFNDNTNLTNCSSTGTASGTAAVGGLAGEIDNSTVDKCYSTASVSYSGSSVVNFYGGGLVSRLINAIVTNCYATGNVNNETKGYCGGFVASISSESTIDKCYSTGSVTLGGDKIGGFIGNNGAAANAVTNSFWNVETDGIAGNVSGANNEGATGKTTEQMKSQSTFTNAGWSTEIWNMGDEINNGYPYLDWQNPGGSPLPVELTSFTAIVVNNNVQLTWQTATEVNNYGFNIERCVKLNAGSENWIKVGFVQGHGNSNSPKNYSFTDKSLKSGNYSYRLNQIDTDGKFEYSDVVEVTLNNETPDKYELSQNFPNPFNPSTTISYSIPKNVKSEMSKVKLIVYDILGNEVATLVNELKNAGFYEVSFDGSKLSSGTYFYTLQSGNFTETKKLLLLK